MTSRVEPCEEGVRWTMSVPLAREVARLLGDEATRTGDSEWREDSLALYSAADVSDDEP